MKVTVLIENTSANKLLCEHGLSLLIEYTGKKILLDAGSTTTFSDNARSMGIDLTKIDIAVLSHGHYDHSGGFTAFFEQNKTAKLYARKEAINTYHSGNGGMHEISVPKAVLSHSDRFILVSENIKIADGIYLVGHSTNNLSSIGKKSQLYKEENGSLVADDFAHEQSLVFDTAKGLIIFNSCSHGGVANIIKEVKSYCGNKNIYAYIGGLHMKGKINGEEICTFSDTEIDSLCDVIHSEKLHKIYTGHCTGLAGFNEMQKRLGNTVSALTTGLIFEV